MAALMFTGCADSSGDSSGPDKRVTARLTLASLGDTLRPEIDSAGRPDPPAGFTDNDISALATILVDLASTSFSRGTLEVKEVDDTVERVLGPLEAIYPDTAVEFLEAVSKKYGPIPWQRMLVDPFGPGSQPRGAAEILKVTWDAEGGTHSGDRLCFCASRSRGRDVRRQRRRRVNNRRPGLDDRRADRRRRSAVAQGVADCSGHRRRRIHRQSRPRKGQCPGRIVSLTRYDDARIKGSPPCD